MSERGEGRNKISVRVIIWPVVGGLFLILVGPTVWARWQINRFGLQWARVWTDSTLFPGSGACSSSMNAITEQMRSYLQRAGGSDSLAALHQGVLACLQSDLQQAGQVWRSGSTRSRDPVLSLFAAVATFAQTPGRMIETPYAGGLGKYGYHRCIDYDERGDVAAAVRWCEFSLAYAPNKITADKLASLYEERGGKSKAQDAWKLLQEKVAPDSSDHWWAAAKIAEIEQDWAATATAYHQAARLAEGADSFDAFKGYLREGQMWLRAKEFALAEVAYRSALALYPDRVEAYLGIGEVYRAQRRYAWAVNWYKRAQKADPASCWPDYYLGLAAHDERRYQDALAFFEHSLAIKADNASALYYKSVTLDALKRRAEAAETLAQAIANHKNPPPIWLDLQEKWRRYPVYEEDPDRWWEKGQAAERERDWAQAATFYHKGASKSLPPDDIRFLVREALMYRYLAEWDRAAAIYEDVIRRYPDRLDAYLGRGDVAQAQQQYEEAEQWFSRALAVAPEDYRPFYNLGVVLYHQERYTESLDMLTRSLALRPDHPWSLYFRAVDLNALGRSEEAIITLEQAITVHQHPPASWTSLLAQWRGE